MDFVHIDAMGNQREYERPELAIGDLVPECCGRDMVLTQLDETRDQSLGFTCAKCGSQERTA